MFIANAVFDSMEFGKTRLKICSDIETENKWKAQDDDQLLHMCYDKELPDTVMKIAATRQLPAVFSFRGDTCKLISYSYNNEERYYNKYRENHVVARVKVEKASSIIVYENRCSCPVCSSQYGYDNIENICGIISLKESPKRTVEIDLQRCNRCLRYFIDKHSLEIYEKEYGRLNISQHSEYELKYETDDLDDYVFAPDSILSRNGYSTRLERSLRWFILSDMMERGIPKAEIKNKLSEFIDRRGTRCYQAVHIWRSDLKYVNDYQLRNEEKVIFKDSDI